jgi:hypothetical protein
MTHAQFHLRRFRVLQGGVPIYDQTFHLGVNVVRGENGSGKSTIADFIFYALGGEFDNWKTVAANCDQVQAEIVTAGGVITTRRAINKAQTPIEVFFGPFEEAAKQGLDGWQLYPIRRQTNSESFSQIIFRAAGIPEAQSQGASNITMHQLLRLLYSDQRTPASFLFRYESFDTREIREAVGDLLCGISGYEAYEIELMLRELNKQFDGFAQQLDSRLKSLPDDETLARVETVIDRIGALEQEYVRLTDQINNVDELVDGGQVKEFMESRRHASSAIKRQSAKISQAEQTIHTSKLEIADLTSFVTHLEELSEKLPKAQTSSEIVGKIEFTHCPACLAPLNSDHGPDHCILCGTETHPEHERSRYLQIKMDIDIQIRESKQLLDEKERSSNYVARELRALRQTYQDQLSEFAVRFELSTSPRDSFVAERYQRLGQIDREIRELARLKERVAEIQKLSDQKARIQEDISRLKDRQKALETASANRRRKALTLVSDKAKQYLKEDLDRQVEFRHAQSIEVNFRDNSILVDNELNFAESSNVIVKNAVVLALLSAATMDADFYHPRFLLMDNIEDKGMEQQRSHNFQEIIVNASKSAKYDHQIIFTTSMFNTELENDEYVVGPYYTSKNRTLAKISDTS